MDAAIPTLDRRINQRLIPKGARGGAVRCSAAIETSLEECPKVGALHEMEIRCINPLTDSSWDEFVSQHVDASFFHTASWARVLSKTYGHVPAYVVGSHDGKMVALLPMLEVRSPLTGSRGVCLPFTDACGPLAHNDQNSAAVVDYAFRQARERSWKHVEIRGRIAPFRGVKPATAFFRHTLDLRDRTSVLLSQFDSSVRRAIRKAERCGLKFQILRSREAVLAYYQLHCRTRRRHGAPPQPLSFFLNIHSEIMESGAGFVALATKNSVPVAGAVFFHFAKGAIYKFGASEEDQQELRGNNLVMWEAIRFLTDSGFESLDFGRTSLNNEGLRRFKLSWGTKEETIEYFKFDTGTQTWVTSQDRATGFHTAVFSHLPSAVNRLAGALIYPHLD